MAGIFYWIFCYPIDVIKTSIQIDALDRNLRENKNVLQTISNIHKKSGISGFFRGASPGFIYILKF